MRSPVRTAVLLLAVGVLGALASGCSDPTPPGGTVPSTGLTSSGPATPAATPAGSASSEPSATTAAGKNDLPSNKTERTLSAPPLTATVDYSTTLPIRNWQPEVTKPLRIVVTALNNRSKGQKIYLSRVSASVSAYDANGLIDGPRAITDTANISPGYFVTFPTEYGQTLLLPAVDNGANRLTIDFTYEFVAQVQGEKGSQRDYAKQTAVDRITVPLT